jgi:hypothetical protein
LGKEDEGGEAVLGAISKEAGAAPSSGERRRPWRELAGTHGRKRRASQGEKERGGKEREGGVAFFWSLQEVDSTLSGKQEVARRRPCTGHASALPTGRRRKQFFGRKPPRV